jgi:hypothetical protein
MSPNAVDPQVSLPTGNHTALLMLGVLVLVLVATRNTDALVKVPVAVGWAAASLLLRWLVIRPLRAVLRMLEIGPWQLVLLALTALAVAKVAQVTGFRYPVSLAALGWGWWITHRKRGPARQRAADRTHARAQQRHAAALNAQAKRLEHDTATANSRRPVVVRMPVTRPTRNRRRNTTRTRTRNRAPAGKPSAPAAEAPPFWAPPPIGLDPVVPSWLGGGLWRRLRRR